MTSLTTGCGGPDDLAGRLSLSGGGWIRRLPRSGLVQGAFWGIHVTGAARRCGCLQAVRRRPRQARRVPTHPRRRWRGSPRSMAGDEVLVAHRFRGRRRVHPPGSPSRQRVPVRDRARRTGLRLSGYPRGALCCDLDYVANSTKSPIGAGDGGEVRHIMRRTTGPRETGNSLFACQLGVCSGRGSEPETAHVCNVFAFISRSTLGIAIGRLEGDVSQRCARIVNKETTMPDSFML